MAKPAPKPVEKKAQKDPIYVGVYDAKVVQKSLLESSKGVIHLLKDYNTIEQIRQKKLAAFKKFDALVEEVGSLVAQLKKHLPVHSLDQPSSVSPTAKNTSVQDTQLDGLDKELADIERKLSTLK